MTHQRAILLVLSTGDAQVVATLLQSLDAHITCTPVTSAADVPAALHDRAWDAMIVGGEFLPPGDRSLLQVIEERDREVPVIVFCDPGQEARAIELMHSGVHDYVLRSHPARLGPAVMREIDVASARRHVRGTTALPGEGDIQRVEADLRRSERRYRNLVESSPDGIALIGDDGSIELANSQLARLLGLTSAEQVVGTHFIEYLEPDQHESALGLWQQHRSNAVLEDRAAQYNIRRVDGTMFPADVRTALAREEETGRLIATVTVHDITERAVYEAQLQHLALHDTVTGLPNRTLLQDRLQQSIAMARQDSSHLAVLLVDLNQFKRVNDTYGHAVGDHVLREVGGRLATGLRESDTLARLGGDEFGVMLPHTDLLRASEVATKLALVMETPIAHAGHEFNIGVTIGIALYPDHGDDIERLLRNADIAMYLAKDTNSGYAVYASERDTATPVRLTLSGALRTAIESEQLVLHFQPKVSLSGGQVTGAEALVRWQHPVHGTIPPDQFIPLAEHSGLIRPLTDWVMKNALAECARCHARGFDLGVAINLSARSLHDPHAVTALVQALDTSKVPPDRVSIELTESVIMGDPHQAMGMLGELIDLGVRISIDDFGTGYSSLAYLHHLRAHEVKIDRSFVTALGAGDENTYIVKAVIELGHNLGLEVVAEGVEDQATLETLAMLKCDGAQGYHLARPMPAPDMMDWLEQQRKRVLKSDKTPLVGIVEDDPELRDTLRSFLEMEGYAVTAFPESTHIELLDGWKRPDIALVDIMLSGISGIEIAGRLQDGEWRGVPMIAMSASQHMIESARETRLFRATLEKPFELHHLSELLHRFAPHR